MPAMFRWKREMAGGLKATACITDEDLGIRAVSVVVSPISITNWFQVESALLAEAVGKLKLFARAPAIHHQRIRKTRLILSQHMRAECANRGGQHQ